MPTSEALPVGETRRLLDTHTFLWMATHPRRLGAAARKHIEDPRNSLFLSLASVWEISIKTSLGKLQLPGSVASFLDQQLAATRTSLLPISFQHAVRVAELAWHHRDPFDRLLVAQSLHEQIPLLSRDPTLDAYGVERIW